MNGATSVGAGNQRGVAVGAGVGAWVGVAVGGAVGAAVAVDVAVRLNQAGMVKMALIDLGVPPGFSVETEDLSQLVDEGVISRYELTGRQIIIYVEDLSAEKPLTFSYRLRARFPMRAQTPPSSVYDYYNPGDTTVRAPLEVTVD